MKYYIISIEQTKGAEEGAINEYITTEKVADEKTALTKHYTKCANVSNALRTTHYYADIRIVNSLGGVIKKDVIGTYVEDTPTPEPTE